MQIKTTQYGLSVKAGGWDGVGDSGTDAWQGNHGNTLNTASCALTISAEALLAQSLPSLDPRRLFSGGQVIPDRLNPGILLKVVWPGTNLVSYRTFDDRAPEDDPRLDLFNPWAFDSRYPDFGQVSVV